jgi:hypothetical protein
LEGRPFKYNLSVRKRITKDMHKERINHAKNGGR